MIYISFFSITITLILVLTIVFLIYYFTKKENNNKNNNNKIIGLGSRCVTLARPLDVQNKNIVTKIYFGKDTQHMIKSLESLKSIKSIKSIPKIYDYRLVRSEIASELLQNIRDQYGFFMYIYYLLHLKTHRGDLLMYRMEYLHPISDSNYNEKEIDKIVKELKKYDIKPCEVKEDTFGIDSHGNIKLCDLDIL